MGSLVFEMGNLDGENCILTITIDDDRAVSFMQKLADDAERYRKLRDNDNFTIVGFWNEELRGADLDSAIDEEDNDYARAQS